MAKIIELTPDQVEKYAEFCFIRQTIKELTEQANEICTEIEQQVYDSDAADDEPVVLIVKDNIIEFSVVPKSFKFDYDIKKYIEETNAYDTLTVSSTAAKKDLSSEQVSKYFTIDKGNRRLKIK